MMLVSEIARHRADEVEFNGIGRPYNGAILVTVCLVRPMAPYNWRVSEIL